MCLIIKHLLLIKLPHNMFSPYYKTEAANGWFQYWEICFGITLRRKSDEAANEQTQDMIVIVIR